MDDDKATGVATTVVTTDEVGEAEDVPTRRPIDYDPNNDNVSTDTTHALGKDIGESRMNDTNAVARDPESSTGTGDDHNNNLGSSQEIEIVDCVGVDFTTEEENADPPTMPTTNQAESEISGSRLDVKAICVESDSEMENAKPNEHPVIEASATNQDESEISERGGDVNATCVESDSEINNTKPIEPAGSGSVIFEASVDTHASAPSDSQVQTMDAKDEPVRTDLNDRHIGKEGIRGDGKESSEVEQTSKSEDPQQMTDEGKKHEPQTKDAALVLDREILFDDNIINIQAFDNGSAGVRQKEQGWTNQQWKASDKVLTFIAPVLRVIPGRYFWSSEVYEKRMLAIYNNPHVILVMRLPKDMDEVRRLSSVGGLESPEKDIHAFLVAESVANPNTCKIRLSQLTHATSVAGKDSTQSGSQGLRNSMNMPQKTDYRKRSCFDMLSPTETVTLSAAFLPADSFEDIEYMSEKALNDTHRCEDAIVTALLNAHFLVDQAWRHQVVLGTPQSYVISGNDSILQESLASALGIQRSRGEHKSDKLDSSILDTKDGSGKTALHYACSRRKNSTIQILVSAGADCSISQTVDEFTPCHICAGGLDEKCLSVVLAASYPSRPDPNALDNHGRTPMYLACHAAVERKDFDSNNDGTALDLCLSALEAWGGQLMVDSPKCKELLHPVHCASAKLKSTELSVILSHCNLRYPLVLGPSDPCGISLSAKFHYPIHAALVSLRDAIAESFEENCDSIFNAEFIPLELPLVKTLRTLLEHGFEPNERLEGIVGQGDALKRFSCYFGFSPLQILALAAADARAIELKKQESGEEDVEMTRLLRNMTKMIQDSAEILLKNGARTNLAPPPLTRLDRPTPTGCYSLEESLQDQNFSMQVGYREASWVLQRVNIDGNDRNISLLGGANRIKMSVKAFAAMGKSVKNFGSLNIESSRSLDSGAPSGSDIFSCAICWKEFGIITNRKHLCRVSCRYVCNECSTKRLIENGSEQRISDGQFLLGSAEVSNEAAKSRADREEQMHKQRQSVTQARKSLGLKQTSGGSSSADTDVKSTPSTKEKITSAISGLAQAKDAVLERGDKLESLADKTEALNQASLDFASMAKELNRSQNSWW
mmetsp:Transcript_34091/g.82441  ORF Transcript_34091/g.82441 Transcript_34091/m.82441 type:complete len:1114 (+) Transcript_34091:88-3429(+)|eukprot:CAMPEP_0181081844 /NCGR_PEP_ID=MMETSP1071-20121207/3311_1 /TAXON_ID=35127 /ORGANISM="Thalassiosira sp., Strain NH16" /LENGTH=1113 /DNA_ID=CAMNT_0023163403 /DNA_START=73 /DNA_END=3414 /DNA_ORIENTATION=+